MDNSIEGLQETIRNAISLGVEMPETWPVIMMWAEIGRRVIKDKENGGENGDEKVNG